MNRIAWIILASLLCTPVFAAEGHVRKSKEPVANQYIVVLEEPDRAKVPALAQALANKHGGTLERVFAYALHGFQVTMKPAEAEALSHNPLIRWIEEVAVVHLSGSTPVGGGDPFWNLDRIDQRSPSLDGTYQYCGTGSGVVVYVIDSGVQASHPDLAGRVKTGVNKAPPLTDVDASFNATNPCGETLPIDNAQKGHFLNSAHGTAVATVIGGTTLGVAHGVTIVPLRVFNCNGDWGSSVATSETGSLTAAADWIAGPLNQDDGTPRWNTTTNVSAVPAVLNMSLRSLVDPTIGKTAFESALETLIKGGITAVAAAGNGGNTSAALTQTPSRLGWSNNSLDFNFDPRVIVVGGTMRNDVRWVCANSEEPQENTTCE